MHAYLFNLFIKSNLLIKSCDDLTSNTLDQNHHCTLIQNIKVQSTCLLYTSDAADE